jgi:hypothetical protein
MISTTYRTRVQLLTLAAAVALTGCTALDSAATKNAAPVAATSVTLQGMVHGGQQPVSGASVYLFVPTVTGYGGAAVSLLNPTASGVLTDSAGNGYVTTAADGSFTITSDYTCPTAGITQVYLAATGGNPGLAAGTNNKALALIAALGPCANLTSSTFISINEVTTVGAVWALSPFMSGVANIGTSPLNTSGLATAFASANQLANFTTGAAPGSGLPPNSVLPVSEINTIADILVSCINTAGGVAGDQTPCGKLFAAATPPGVTAPTDTVGAAIAIAQNPGSNVTALFNAVTPSSPFQPTLSAAPTDWTIAVQYTNLNLNNPQAIALDQTGNVWIANCGSANCSTSGPGSVTQLNGNGISQGTTSAGGINVPLGIAIDLNGNAWIANYAGNSVTELNSSLMPVAGPFTGGGLNGPNSLAIDNLGNVWLTNLGSPNITELNSAGTALTSSSGDPVTGVISPTAVAVNPH